MDILLSICIPTYNRAATLKLALESIKQQIKGYTQSVEVCISDNCSEDETEQIVRLYQNEYLIRYHRMDTVQEPVLNWDYTITYMASGKYVLMIGDDDVFINNGIGRLIYLIERGEQDYYYLNHCHKQIGEIEGIVWNNNCRLEINPKECECFKLEDSIVERWEEILTWEGKFQDINMLFIGNHLMKPEIWKSFGLANKVSKLQLDINKESTDWFYQTWSPQVEIVANGMMGKKCGYLGMPVVLQGLGINDNNLSAKIIQMQSYWFRIFKELRIDDSIFYKYKEYIDKRIIYRFQFIMTYQRELLKLYPDILKYIRDNVTSPVFFEEMYSGFSDYQNDYMYNIAYQNFENDLLNLLNEKEGKVVLWGTGDVARKLLDSSPILRKKVNYVVDGSIAKQGTLYGKNKISIVSPETLLNQEVAIIIIATLGHQDEIIQFIEDNIKKPAYYICQKGICLAK